MGSSAQGGTLPINSIDDGFLSINYAVDYPNTWGIAPRVGGMCKGAFFPSPTAMPNSGTGER